METRKCKRCRKEKSINDFYPSRKNVCKDCVKAQNKIYDINTRMKVLDGYGGKCACCGEENYEFLQLDHKEGGGYQERKIKKYDTKKNWRKTIKEGFPGEFELLCANCNISKGLYGYCPHQGRPKGYDDPFVTQVPKRKNVEN